MSDRRIVVFRSYLREGVEAEYEPDAAHIHDLAVAMPGFVSVKTFVAEDGERVTLAEFASEPELAAWREQPEHRAAQQRGRDRYYASYSLDVCSVVRSSRWAGKR